MRHDAPQKLMVSLAIAMVVLAVSLLLSGLPLTAVGGPDLIIESITVDPPIPDLNQPFTMTIMTRNQGDANAGYFRDYVYLDPVDNPPGPSTPSTSWCGYLSGLGAGAASWCRLSNLSFSSTVGCNHVIYAWADKTNLVTETIETNNVLSQTVCVGVTCQADAYEPDNTCESSRWLTNTMGTAQHHTLCPIGDEDWVKFATVAGITYTLEAKNLGMHADPLLYLYNGCNGVAQFGEGPRIVWRSPASGVAYVRVVHRQSTYGPLTGYDLALTADKSGVYDRYEPDDTCASARDLPTDGTRQTHYFQVISDPAIGFLVNSKDQFPIAESCRLGPLDHDRLPENQ